MRLFSTAFLVFGVMVGCSSEDPFSELKQDAQQFQLERAAEMELIQEPDFLIGSYQTVNNIGSVAVDEAGRIFAVNRTRNRIEVYSAEGRPIQTLGKSGSDPGEFRQPELIKTDSRNLYAFDKSLQRINVF
ncbi:MAG TPA: hypothetical protein DD671_10590, partial [Balneolaceae bacterium]|nr:hypothetical protein [Balneolaceae bacterium]